MYEKTILFLCHGSNDAGNGIPEEDIRRRFKRGIDNLINLYLPICDSVLVYNNMNTPAQLVARKKTQVDSLDVIEHEMWNQLIQKI